MTVPEILETIMLICFGFSWPISVVKNIKAKTAKSMSLPFILLILFGYFAGITGKILNGNIGYVLIAYFINVLSVSANVVVYFINQNHDRKAEKKNKKQEKFVEANQYAA